MMRAFGGSARLRTRPRRKVRKSALQAEINEERKRRRAVEKAKDSYASALSDMARDRDYLRAELQKPWYKKLVAWAKGVRRGAAQKSGGER